MSGWRKGFVWASFALATIVVAGVIVQLYLIAAWIFGEAGALTAHKDLGGVSPGRSGLRCSGRSRLPSSAT